MTETEQKLLYQLAQCLGALKAMAPGYGQNDRISGMIIKTEEIIRSILPSSEHFEKTDAKE